MIRTSLRQNKLCRLVLSVYIACVATFLHSATLTAQMAPVVAPSQPSIPNPSALTPTQINAALAAAQAFQAASAPLVKERNGISVTSLAKLRQLGSVDSQILTLACSDPASNICAETASESVRAQCEDSARFFKRDAKGWKITSFVLVLSSAAFTAVGASATLANAKIFSTLGGTTGIGAASAAANTNVSSDVGGMATISATLAAFEKLIQSGAKDGGPAANEVIYKSAPAYAAQCYAAAAAATGTAGK